MSERQRDDELITVCSSCKRASCWQGKFYCEAYRSAGTEEITLQQAIKMRLEHPSYWGREDD